MLSGIQLDLRFNLPTPDSRQMTFQHLQRHDFCAALSSLSALPLCCWLTGQAMAESRLRQLFCFCAQVRLQRSALGAGHAAYVERVKELRLLKLHLNNSLREVRTICSAAGLHLASSVAQMQHASV